MQLNYFAAEKSNVITFLMNNVLFENKYSFEVTCNSGHFSLVKSDMPQFMALL